MIDVSVLTTALASLLSADGVLVTAGCTVERGTRINFDPARCPWIGVYPGTVDTAPRTAMSKSWLSAVELQVVAQTASLSGDGTAASDLLEVLIKEILDVVNNSLTLNISGSRVLSVGREYRYVLFDSDGLGDLFMPQAVIKVKMEVRS